MDRVTQIFKFVIGVLFLGLLLHISYGKKFPQEIRDLKRTPDIIYVYGVEDVEKDLLIGNIYMSETPIFKREEMREQRLFWDGFEMDFESLSDSQNYFDQVGGYVLEDIMDEVYLGDNEYLFGYRLKRKY